MAKRKAGTEAPERLSDEQRLKLRQWLAASYPKHLRRAQELEDACLDYHRSRGNLMADWLACVRTWVRNDASGQFTYRSSLPAPMTRTLPPSEPDRLAEARRERDADPPKPETLAAAKAAIARYMRVVKS